MKIKKLKLLLILTPILLFGCKNHLEYKTIVLKTTGLVETQADEANITLNLDCINANIVLAKSCLILKSNELNELLKKYKIDQKDILTTRINLNKSYEWINSSNVFKGYSASITTNVTIRNLQILDKLYSELLTNKELTIGNLTFQHSNIDSLNELAYLNALKNADKLSNRILAELNVKHKEIIKISNIEITVSESDPVKLYGSYNQIAKEEETEKNNVTIHFGNMIAERQIYVQYRIY